MSKIGKAPINLPSGVKIQINTGKSIYGDTQLIVEGNLGKLSLDMRPGIEVVENNNSIELTRVNELQLTKSLHGMYRSVINGMVEGVSKGFRKDFEDEYKSWGVTDDELKRYKKGEDVYFSYERFKELINSNK